MNKNFIPWIDAGNICIVKTLGKLGHYPTRISGKQAWFLSPLRVEKTPSFNVSLVKNLWYDFGTGKGGNVIDLVMLLLNCTFHESLLFLTDNSLSLTFTPPVEIQKKNHTGKIKIVRVQEIKNPALLQYLRHRRIPVEIAGKFCSEVHYQLRDKEYFSLGLKNRLDGWELRNRLYKNSSSPKSYTYFNNSSQKLIITEGMFDFLSLATLDKELQKNSDAIILNSLVFVKDIEPLIPKYKEVLLFLDNDPAGSQATNSLLEQFGHSSDQREIYNNYKDLNEKLRNEK